MSISEFEQRVHSRDIQKNEFLREFDDVAPRQVCWSYTYKMMGVTAVLSGLDELDNSCKEYIEDNLKPFLVDRSEDFDFEIFYKKAPNDFSKIESGLWENPDPDIWILPEIKSKPKSAVRNASNASNKTFGNTSKISSSDFVSWNVIQRDFSAKVTTDFKKAFVIGPEISEASGDTLDNLNAFLFPKFLLKRNAIYLHCSAVVKDGLAYVFYGASGAGKSTLADQCGHQENLKVLGTDQAILMEKEGKLYVGACTRHSPEFPRGDKNFSFETFEVGGLFHLRQLGKYSFKKMDFSKRLSGLIQESQYYIPEVLSFDEYLSVCCKIANCDELLHGEVSYPKGQPVWVALDDKGRE